MGGINASTLLMKGRESKFNIMKDMASIDFVRHRVVAQLQELWCGSDPLQSVLLYGHRGMGKTSIIRNTSEYLSENIYVAYLDLFCLGAVSREVGEGEVVIAISDSIGEALSVPPPEDDASLDSPLATFRNFIQSRSLSSAFPVCSGCSCTNPQSL